MNTQDTPYTEKRLGAGRAWGQRILRQTQKQNWLQSGAPKPSYSQSTLALTMQHLQWRKQFSLTDEPAIVTRGPWTFDRDLEEKRIRLAEEIVQRVDPGPFEDPNYLALLAYQAASIEMADQLLHREHSSRFPQFLLGTVAAPNVNAFATISKQYDCSVIGAHSALIDFIYEAAKALVDAATPIKVNNGKALVRADFRRESILSALAIDPSPATHLYKTLEAYFFNGYPRAFANEELSEESQVTLAHIVGFSERFVIAHEYGHRYASANEWMAAATAENSLWQLELWADAHAVFATTLSAYILDRSCPETSVGAGIFSLTCLEILRQAKSILTSGAVTPDVGTESHPPNRMRANHIAEVFHRLFYVEYRSPDFRDCYLEPKTKNNENLETNETAHAHIHEGAFQYANAIFVIWDSIRGRLLQEYSSGRKPHPMWANATG